MLISHLTWHSGRNRPKKNTESTSDSDIVVVTFDGKSISAVAVYNYKIRRWYDVGHGEYRLIDKPLYWAYAELQSEITPKSKTHQRSV